MSFRRNGIPGTASLEIASAKISPESYNRGESFASFLEHVLPGPHQESLEIPSTGPDFTAGLGRQLGRLLAAGDVICLCGDLGAGKTVFARGIGEGWGALIPLTSPTYNLVHEHRRADNRRLYHIDLYRISGPKEADTLGFDEILDDEAAVILEWPERLEPVLPPDHLWVDISVADEQQRYLAFAAHGERHRQLLAGLRELRGEQS